MANKLNYAEVMERINYYKNDAGLAELHTASKRWAQLFKLTDAPELPEYMTRGVTVAMPSPRVRDMTDDLKSVFASYQTTVTVAPISDSAPSGELKKQADKIEQFLAIKRADFNDGGRFRDELYSRALHDCYFISLMSIGDPVRYKLDGEPDEGYNPDFCQVLTPDPLSCFFPVSGAPARLPLLAREFDQRVRDVESRYSRQQRTEHAGANLAKRNGVWRWEALGDDYARNGDTAAPYGGGAKYGETQSFFAYYDDDYTYFICQNDDKVTGEIVYCEPNVTGGCAALVACGSTTPYREVRYRLGPALIALLQTTLNINLVRSMWAHGVFNAKPDMAIEWEPDAFAQAREQGLLAQVEMEEGAPNLIHVGGKPVPWTVNPNVNIDKLYDGWITEQQDYLSEWREPTDPSTVSDATANAYLTATESIRRRQTSILKMADWIESQNLKMFLHALGELNIEIPAYASNQITLKSGKIDSGRRFTLSGSDLKDFEFNVDVTTKAQTESDLRARVESGMQNVAFGLETRAHVIEMAYTDATAQEEELAINGALDYADPQIQAWVDQAWRDKVRLRSGVIIPPGPPMQVAPDMSGQIGQSPMRPAAIGQATGGSVA